MTKLVKEIELKPYHHQLIVCINAKEKDIEKFVKKNIKPDFVNEVMEEIKKYPLEGDFAGVVYTEIKSLPQTMILSIPVFNETTDSISFLVHECLHVVAHMFRKIGISLSEESEEAYTYLLGHIVYQIIELYNDEKRRKPNNK